MAYRPLADEIRPASLDDVVGQKHILGADGLLRRIIESGSIPNLVFYGPSGTGKTTVANIIAARTNRTLRRINATTGSLSDVKDVIGEVGTMMAPNGILLYLDEIQYFNKKQQQTLLEFIENGSIIEEGNMVDVFTNPQNQTTKEFVKSVDKNTLPESLKSTPVSREYFEGASLAVRLSFFSGNADKPIVSGMIKRFGVDANIISGNTDQLKDRIYGNLLIVIEGPQKALEDSLDYLNSQNLQVEVIGYVK